MDGCTKLNRRQCTEWLHQCDSETVYLTTRAATLGPKPLAVEIARRKRLVEHLRVLLPEHITSLLDPAVTCASDPDALPKARAIAMATVTIPRHNALQLVKPDFASVLCAPGAIPSTRGFLALPLEREIIPNAFGVASVNGWPGVLIPEVVATWNITEAIPSHTTRPQVERVGPGALPGVVRVADPIVHAVKKELWRRLSSDKD
eukprot:CAMPEP_0115278830 /NCGR_PEP_ID=MMETSP0270-20121206/57953_1 /TAXON_ID=71861 /ORGANISM="Scrippsiella trochoidea, Strain CCMP3099" /LENGTH=203 /DNA_ID=CAMNT_0002695505 /DNA_START=203 /DNA_END=811 /DNA_ORIENTATION=+